MTDKTTEEESDTNRIPLGEFISDNSELFLVMGVFAGLSVYISQLPTEDIQEEVIQLGVTSALLVAGIIGLIIGHRLMQSVKEQGNAIIVLYHPSNILVTLFIVLLFSVFYSIGVVVLGFTQVIASFAVALGVYILLTSWLRAIKQLAERIEPKVSEWDAHYIISTSVVSIVLYILLEVIQDLISEDSVVEYAQMEDMTHWEVLPTILYNSIEVSRAFIAFGIVGIVSFAVATAIHYFLKHLYGMWTDYQS